MADVALIGAGRIGRIHGRNAGSTAGITLKYVVDPVAEAAEALAAELGASVATVEQALDDPGIAGVVIASSTDTHLDLCMAAHAAGKAIFCEKPIDLDLARARGAAPRLAGARLFVAFNRRFDANLQALRSAVDAGEIGAVETVNITSHDPAPPPIGFVRTSGGLFRDMAIHDFDTAGWLLGEPVVEVFAAAGCLVDPEIGEAGDVDTAKILLRTAGGRLALISNTRRSGYGYDQRIEVFGAKGMLRAGNRLESETQAWTEAGPAADRIQNFFLDRYAEAYRAEMAHFADVLAGQAPAIGLDDALGALALAEAAQASHDKGQPVRV